MHTIIIIIIIIIIIMTILLKKWLSVLVSIFIKKSEIYLFITSFYFHTSHMCNDSM
jgi:hypothetical protein